MVHLDRFIWQEIYKLIEMLPLNSSNLNQKNHLLLRKLKFYCNSKIKVRISKIVNFLNIVGFPEIIWFGNEGPFHMMVIDMLGPSLEDLYAFCGRKFSLKTVLLLAD